MMGFEVNFDGLVGPTHHYAGLSFGNEASFKNQNLISNPKLAAKQGLQKMKAMADMGLKQAVLPPHERPLLSELRRLGFYGQDKGLIEQAFKQAPEILSALYSASPMWAANAATVSPSADTADQKIHFTSANLCLNYHRSVEHLTTERILKRIFQNPEYFVHHQALPSVPLFGDEGAANHLRFAQDYAQSGVEVFVYGQHYFKANSVRAAKYPARQTLEACQAVARLHQLDPQKTLYIQQNPDVIDLGVFHNDVISVNNNNVFLVHEKAFLNQKNSLNDLSEKLKNQNQTLDLIQVPEESVSVQNAVQSYLFNSQIISRPDGGMSIILPEEARENQAVWNYVDQVLLHNSPIDDVQVFALKESMRNGGGPACLRLRVAMNESELAALHQPILLTENLFNTLNQWIDRHYRDRLSAEDLIDSQLVLESQRALDELSQILALGAIYSFQF